MLINIVIGVSVGVLVLVIMAFVVSIVSAVILGSIADDEYMTNYEKCNGNCEACRDKEQCMNRPYN